MRVSTSASRRPRSHPTLSRASAVRVEPPRPMPKHSTTTGLGVFGASGDLARRKIIPALQSLNGDARRLRVLGAGRSEMSREQFQDIVAEATQSRDLAA